jgi:hypothetical protein
MNLSSNVMESVFQSFVLYFADECPGSAQIMQSLDPVKEDVRYVNVKDLERPLPDWLTGTPTLVHTGAGTQNGDMSAYRGTQAIDFVKQYLSTEHRINELSLDDTQAPTQPIIPNPGDEQLSDQTPQDHKVTEQDIEALMKERDSILRTAPSLQY